jgi:hypothetical protein
VRSSKNAINPITNRNLVYNHYTRDSILVSNVNVKNKTRRFQFPNMTLFFYPASVQ